MSKIRTYKIFLELTELDTIQELMTELKMKAGQRSVMSPSIFLNDDSYAKIDDMRAIDARLRLYPELGYQHGHTWIPIHKGSDTDYLLVSIKVDPFFTSHVIDFNKFELKAL